MTARDFKCFLPNSCSHPPEKNCLIKNHMVLSKNKEKYYKNGMAPAPFYINGEDSKQNEKNTLSQNSAFPSTVQAVFLSKEVLLKENLDHDRIETNIPEKNYEREMPRLTKEIQSDSKANRLKNTTIINQRYQNVLRFPNYRQRKKSAFERKLRRCGVELDGETTISNLRKILQPYIYKEINDILDKYIEVYFMKAFDNIRENINLTSENWSQTLKSSISKSVYKQYCDIANVDPFNPLSIAKEDFPYFQISQRINHKACSVTAENSTKFEIDNSTGHESDTISHCSQFSIADEKIEIDQVINIAEMSSSEQIIECQFNHFTDESNVPRKRNMQRVDELSTTMPDNHLKSSESSCSNRKYQKLVCPNQSYSNNPYVSHYDNSSDSFILQKIQEPGTSEPIRFENRNQSFLLIRKPKDQSSSAIESGIYLSTQNPMTTNNISDHYYAHNYPC